LAPGSALGQRAARTKLFVINCFLGYNTLFRPGLDWLEERPYKPVIGVLPKRSSTRQQVLQSGREWEVLGGCAGAPSISNHINFDPLRRTCRL